MRVSTKNFTTHVSYALATKLFLIFCRLALSVLTARLLGPSDRGLLSLIVQTSGSASTFATMSIGEGLVYSHGTGRFDRSHSVALYLYGSICSILLLTIFLFLASPIISRYIFSDISFNSLIFTIPLGCVVICEYIGLSILKSLNYFTAVNIFSIVSKVVCLSNMSILFFIFGPSLELGLYAYISSGGMICLLLFLFLLDYSNYKIIINFKDFLECSLRSLKIHLSTIITEIEYRADIFIIGALLTFDDVGIYSISVVIAQMLWYVSNAVNSILYPYIFKVGPKNQLDFFIDIMKKLFYASVFCALLLVLIGEFLINFLYGDEFSRSYVILVILLPGLVFDTLSRGLFTWFKAQNMSSFLAYGSLISLFVNVSLNFLLIPILGLEGAALASGLSYVAKFLVLSLVYKYFAQRNL